MSKLKETDDLPIEKHNCGVPGYDLSSEEYAATIQFHINKGHFFLASHLLDAAKSANVLEVIEKAANSIFNQYEN